MSSRRIGSFTNLLPIQEIAVNPFASFNSDSVNKITRILTNGKDGVAFGLDVNSSEFDPTVLNNIDIFKSHLTPYDSSKWSFDPDFTIVYDDTNTKIDALRLNSVERYKNIKFEHSIKLNGSYIQDLIGTNTNCKFNFKFNISIGCPKRIIFFVNNDNNYIDYPNTKDGIITLSVPHNLKLDTIQKGIVLKVNFLMDPNDLEIRDAQDSIYNGQSHLQIDNFDFNLQIVDSKKIIDPISYVSLNGSYSNTYIHPTQKIYVTPGIAVKDDLMLNFKTLQQRRDNCIELDLNDPRVWIKNNPYTVDDFYRDGAEQHAYVYNNKNRSQPLVLTGAINRQTKLLNFWYGDITTQSEDGPILLMDEYKTSPYDEELDYSLDTTNNIKITITQHVISNQHKELYGTCVYFIDKRNNNILKKFEIEYNSSTFTYPQQEFSFYPFDFELPISEIKKENIKLVSSIGPVKVSGDKTKYNNNIVKWGYVVIYYTYFKHPNPNKAYIGLIRDVDLKDQRFREDYVILAKVRFVSANTIDLISYEDRQRIFTYNNQARYVDYSNQLSIEELDLWKDPETGEPDIPITVSDAITKLIRFIKVFGVQSDWKQTDTTKPDYIKNKPIIDTPETGAIDSNDHIPSSKLLNHLQSDWKESDGTKHSYILNKPEIDTTETGLSDSDEHLASSKLIKQHYQQHNGNPGEVFYSNGGHEIEARTILKDYLYVCLTDEDVETCKQNGLDYKYIFNKWVRFGHLNNKQYGIDDDYVNPNTGADKWQWNEEKHRIEQQVNSTDINGFVSTLPTKKISITTRFQSTGTDDDYNGFVLLAYDENGRQHTMSFMRSMNTCDATKYLNPVDGLYYSKLKNNTQYPNGGAYRFTCRLDLNLNTHKILANKGLCVLQGSESDVIQAMYPTDGVRGGTRNQIPYLYAKTVDGITYSVPTYKCSIDGDRLFAPRGMSMFDDGSGVFLFQETAAQLNDEVPYSMRGWNAFKNGIVMQFDYDATGENTIITCKTTKFLLEGESNVSYTETITINLDEYINDPQYSSVKDILQLFKTEARWGYGNYSQSNSTFTNITWPWEQYLIVDVKNNKVWQYNGTTWVNIGLPKNYIHPGTEYYNSIVKKLYWSDENKTVSEIELNGSGGVSKVQSDWAETDSTKPSYIKNKPTAPITQVQVDWNQTDSTKVDYIKNKPDSLDINLIINKIYPVYSIFITMDTRNPHDIFGIGTWVRISVGRCLWGANENQVPGTLIDSKLPNIKGSVNLNPTEENEHLSDEITTTGAISQLRDVTNTMPMGADVKKPFTGFTELYFNAHDYNTIYDDNQSIVQPPAILVNIWQRVEDPTLTHIVKWYDGSTLLRTDYVEHGKAATPPNPPVKEGYVFRMWDSDYSIITSDKNIYTIYDKKQISVTFNYQVSGISNVTRIYSYGDAYGTLPTTTRIGYNLDGWYNGTTKITETTLVKSSSTTIQNLARWVVKNVTITFDYDGGTVSETSRSVAYGQPYGTLPTTTKTGYTFDGWYKGTEKVNENTIVDQDTTISLKAKWIYNYVTVTFDSNY